MPQEVQSPTDLLNKLSQALVQVSRGDPLVALRNELQTQFSAIETRFSGIDKATELQHQDMVRVPTQVDRAVDNLKELIFGTISDLQRDMTIAREAMERRPEVIRFETNHLREFLQAQVATSVAELVGKIEKLKGETDERFLGVGAQFSERDTRTDQRAGDTKLAVDAAFAAAKEATAKIEAGFTKQIDAMISIIDTKTANLAGGISDLKDRMTALESRSATADPIMTAEMISLRAEVKILQNTSNTTGGRSQGAKDNMSAIIAVGAVIIAALTWLSHSGAIPH